MTHNEKALWQQKSWLLSYWTYKFLCKRLFHADGIVRKRGNGRFPHFKIRSGDFVSYKVKSFHI